MFKPDDRLALTALWAAAGRAQESVRSDALFTDPLAAHLAGDEGQTGFNQTNKETDSGSYQAVKTRFFDDFLMQGSHKKGIRQIIIFAAGMDTRAFRLSWPAHTELFELELPSVLDLKEQRLSASEAVPACERHIVKVDLREAWETALVSAGFHPSQPSLWLVEGLFFYLSESAVLNQLARITHLAVQGSGLGFDVVNSDMLTSPYTQPLIAQLEREHVPWISTMDQPEKVLEAYKWNATVVEPGEEQANYGRWPRPVYPRSIPGIPRSFLVTAYR